jgi:hypothetical protein
MMDDSMGGASSLSAAPPTRGTPFPSDAMRNQQVGSSDVEDLPCFVLFVWKTDYFFSLLAVGVSLRLAGAAHLMPPLCAETNLLLLPARPQPIARLSRSSDRNPTTGSHPRPSKRCRFVRRRLCRQISEHLPRPGALGWA